MFQKDVSYFSRGFKCTNDESGRSLIEMLGTIAIITMVMLGAISAAATGMNMWRATQAHDEILTAIQGVTDLYSWDPDGFADRTGDEIMSFACKEEVLDKKCTSNVWESVFGTAMYVEPDSSNPDILTVVIEDVPARAITYLKNKTDTKMITQIECEGGTANGCSTTDRYGFTIDQYKTMIFKHNPSAE